MNYKVVIAFLVTLFSLASMQGNSISQLDCSSYFTWEHIPGTNTKVQFTNESTGEFNSWQWDFGDGVISEVYHPVHEYSAYGTYYVCLTVSDGAGCTDVYCDTVVVAPECDANFNFSYVPTTPVYVQFTDLSSGYPTSWLWYFGDGTTSTEPNPVHPYPIPGNYTVCLVIEHDDSLFNCSDSICKTVIIPDSLNCEADFEYAIDPDDPLKVQFSDYSTGNITDWEWNFGDGTTSTQQDPVHTFPGPADYMVCLKVLNSDSTEHCIHFLCETVSLEDPNFCTADFHVVADSSSQIMYQYSFIDESTGSPDLWLWDFGDGNISHDQNPEHVYESSGTYEVCLNTWNSNYPGCTDSYCILVKTADYYKLGGHALIGGNPINNPAPTGDTGVAIIYRQRDDSSIIPLDTNEFYELGYYWFPDMMEMGYRVKVSLTEESSHYNEYIPSYYPGTIHWQDADVFMLDQDLFEMNTELIEAHGVETGPGMIRGKIVDGNRYGVESHRSYGRVPIILTDQADKPLAWTATNDFGQFSFEDISLGTYHLHADITGMWSQTETVDLSSGFPVNDSARIVVYSDSPFNINEPASSIKLVNLYPNPVSDQLSLNLEVDRRSQLMMNIYDLTGHLLMSRQYFLEKGKNSFTLETSGYPPGLYMMGLISNDHNGMISKKFIKK